MTLPLEGIKMLDLSRMAPGPYCGMILGDLGMDILKVEEPQVMGRRTASGAPPGVPGANLDQRAAAYNAIGRNKKSIALNLRAEEARQIFYKLSERADVVLEGFRPGVVKRLGVDYETIRAINPRIVYCALTGFGQGGPYQNLPGHDINYISIAGALGTIGLRDGPPVIPSNYIADYAGGALHAAIGIMAALMAREKTGRGQYVDISMTDGVLSMLTAAASQYFSTGVVPRPGEVSTGGALPHYNVYQTKDGKYISLGCLEPWFYENLCRILGREDFIPHQNTTGEKREEIFSYFREVFQTKTRDEWFDLLTQSDICVAKVYSLDEVFSDPQMLHRNMVVEVEHPTEGKVKQVGIPAKLSETPGQIRNTAPLLGQHTDEVLSELGYPKEEIEALRRAGAVK